MPRGRGGGWFGRGSFGRNFGWPGNPYPFCRWFPWLPRWWWTGLYGPITPYRRLLKGQETAILKDQKKLMEEDLERIKRRLEELKK